VVHNSITERLQARFIDLARTFFPDNAMTDTTDDPLVGKPAPDFCLPDADEKTICRADFSGSFVVLYFYPRDNTPGCTLEARGFSAAVDDFSALGAVILGVSGDSVDSHKSSPRNRTCGSPSCQIPATRS